METAVHVSPTGDDGSSGSPEAPLRSVAKALASARPGAVVHLAAGEYEPFGVTGLAGTPRDPIVIRGQCPPPVDFTPLEALDHDVLVLPLRQALEDGRLALATAAGLTAVNGRGHETGLTVTDCRHVRIENLVLRDARMNLAVSRSRDVTLSNCVAFGDPAVSVHGFCLRIQHWSDRPSGAVRFHRCLAYGLKECGFSVQAGAAFDVQWDCCIAHGMDSGGGDGFSFGHVIRDDNPLYHNGVDYRMKLTRCAALRNRLDGFDLGNGVGGLTLEYCLGDRNGWGAYYAKDLKVWTGGNTFRHCRMTGRVLFVRGTAALEDFKTGVKEDGPNDERKYPTRPAGRPEGSRP